MLLTPAHASPGAIGFNDLTTDAVGRIYVGSLAFRVFGGDAPKPGHLHRINLDGSVETLSDGVMLTNGLGFSPDGRRALPLRLPRARVRVYDVAADGTVGPWRLFASLGQGRRADGLKVAPDGSVWVADARGGRVAVFDPDGSHRMDVTVPLPMVTSLCFGGDDLRDLYVVTGSDGGPQRGLRQHLPRAGRCCQDCHCRRRASPSSARAVARSRRFSPRSGFAD